MLMILQVLFEILIGIIVLKYYNTIILNLYRWPYFHRGYDYLVICMPLVMLVHSF